MVHTFVRRHRQPIMFAVGAAAATVACETILWFERRRTTAAAGTHPPPPILYPRDVATPAAPQHHGHDAGHFPVPQYRGDEVLLRPGRQYGMDPETGEALTSNSPPEAWERWRQLVADARRRHGADRPEAN